MENLIPVYTISGLGADETVFEHLSLPGCALFYLPWLQPEPGETIVHYAGRMAAGIRHPEPILLGLSFGGIMAGEIARIIPVKRVWLLSTVKQRSEMPPYMRFGAVLPLHRVALALNVHRWMGPIENYNLGVDGPEEKEMAARFRESVNKDYLRWAVDAIVRWRNTTVPAGALHIHGDKDRIFPIRYVRPDHVIEGGGHLLVHNRAHAVSDILRQDLARLMP
jgi:pimeloyl-ACP methyl ester carboxylesterase